MHMTAWIGRVHGTITNPPLRKKSAAIVIPSLEVGTWRCGLKRGVLICVYWCIGELNSRNSHKLSMFLSQLSPAFALGLTILHFSFEVVVAPVAMAVDVLKLEMRGEKPAKYLDKRVVFWCNWFPK